MKGQRKSKLRKIKLKEGDCQMGISDKIEAFINELMKDDDDWVELKRNELASIFRCVPSQINYVISTRFSPERGYVVESRRGGGGYLRIRRAETDSPVRTVICGIGDAIDYPKSRSCVKNLLESHVIDEGTAALILSAVSDNALCIQQPYKDELRASIMKHMLAALKQKNIEEEE